MLSLDTPDYGPVVDASGPIPRITRLVLLHLKLIMRELTEQGHLGKLKSDQRAYATIQAFPNPAGGGKTVTEKTTAAAAAADAGVVFYNYGGHRINH